MALDFGKAAETLRELFREIQPLLLEDSAPVVPSELTPAFNAIFTTSVQAYREGLLGCSLARLQDQTINIRLPYVSQGSNAFNGRTLDEEVINPFFQEHRIPSSRGPYLAMFRRDFRFNESKRAGLRDKAGYDAFLALITALESMAEESDLRDFTAYLLYHFAKLREASEIQLSRLQRISQEQYEKLIGSLLDTPSGGRLPVIIVVAALRSIKEFFGLNWNIEYQGINVADSQSGVGGDITVLQDGSIVFAAEVTERPLERSRVIATFNTKIAPHSIENYLFFVRLETLSEEAQQQARQYFAQGHEVNFLDVKMWVLMLLATMGKRGRELFENYLLELLNDQNIPRAIKVSWNDHIAALTIKP